VAGAGVSGGGSALPHRDKIQASFGAHDVSGVDAHVGGPAGTAAESIGAQAYATGNDVAFRAAPDLHTAAHEAAHVVQQRSGVSLLGGVGQADDRYERQADQVADAVVQGRSAEGLLSELGGGAQAATRGDSAGAVQSSPVQLRKQNSSAKPELDDILEPTGEGPSDGSSAKKPQNFTPDLPDDEPEEKDATKCPAGQERVPVDVEGESEDSGGYCTSECRPKKQDKKPAVAAVPRVASGGESILDANPKSRPATDDSAAKKPAAAPGAAGANSSDTTVSGADPDPKSRHPTDDSAPKKKKKRIKKKKAIKQKAKENKPAGADKGGKGSVTPGTGGVAGEEFAIKTIYGNYGPVPVGPLPLAVSSALEVEGSVTRKPTKGSKAPRAKAAFTESGAQMEVKQALAGPFASADIKMTSSGFALTIKGSDSPLVIESESGGKLTLKTEKKVPVSFETANFKCALKVTFKVTFEGKPIVLKPLYYALRAGALLGVAGYTCAMVGKTLARITRLVFSKAVQLFYIKGLIDEAEKPFRGSSRSDRHGMNS